MNKKQWQEHHGFTDGEMEEICWIKEVVNGGIVKVSEVPRDHEGRPVPFSERREKDVYAMQKLWEGLAALRARNAKN